MTARNLSDTELLKKLNTLPALREHIGRLLLAVDDETTGI
jgi:hypothetical protein